MRTATLLAVSLFLWAPASRADILPSNTHPCAEAHLGDPCQTDACHPGVCKTIGLSCPKLNLDCLPCMLEHTRDTGTGPFCEAECASERVPCVVCVADDMARDQATPTYRFDDCYNRKAGEACKSEDCKDGVCGVPACAEPPCPDDFKCVVPVPKRSLGVPVQAWIASGVAGALGLFALLQLLRRRRAGDETRRKP